MKLRFGGLRSVLVAASVIGLFGAAVSAAADPLHLTLEEALTRAQKANAALLATSADIQNAQAAVRRSQYWVPQNPFVSAGLLQTPQAGFGPNYGITLSQELEIAGQRWKRMAVADAALQKANWDQKQAELELNANVKMAYTRALLSLERVALTTRGTDGVSDLAQHEERSSGESRTGLAIDRNQVMIQDARSRRERNAAELEKAEAFDSLRYLLGLPADQDLELSGAVDRTVRPLRSERELVQLALERRPDLNAAQQDADRAEKQIPLVKRESIPNITLSGTYSRFEGDNFAGGDLGLYVPVLRGSDPELVDALADRDRTRYQREDLRRSIERDVRQARRVCVAAGEDLELSQNIIVPRSRANLELERQRYERGEVTAAEVIGLLIDSQYAEKEYLDAVQTYADAWVELEKTVAGEP